jgi:Adenosine specific kinase
LPLTYDVRRIELRVVAVEKPDRLNLMLGQSHFIKTVEDLREALAGGRPGASVRDIPASPFSPSRSLIPRW